jgi:hypothetical protein
MSMSHRHSTSLCLLLSTPIDICRMRTLPLLSLSHTQMTSKGALTKRGTTIWTAMMTVPVPRPQSHTHICGQFTKITSNWNNTTINILSNINHNYNSINNSVNNSCSTYPSMQWGRGTSLFSSPLRDRGGSVASITLTPIIAPSPTKG